MAPTKTATRADQRARLLEVALKALEQSGPEALQARALTAEIGTSTQAVYTLFGGMPGLFEAIVVEGFVRFARHVQAVPETDDAVADHFSKGAAYCDWAFANPQLYRLIFGLTGGGLRSLTGMELTLSRSPSAFAEGRAALEVLMHSLDRVKAAGRIRPVDTAVVAGQFLSATHGYILLQIGGAFDADERGLDILSPLGVNLMVGLGDEREAAERSLAAAVAARAS